MPWASEKARAAALLRIARASARTMADETAAMWCGKNRTGRGAAEAVRGGVVPLDLLCRLGERLEEGDHGAREGTGGLGGEQVDKVALLQRVAVVTWGGVDARPRLYDGRAARRRARPSPCGRIQWTGGSPACCRERKGMAVGGGSGSAATLRAAAKGAPGSEGREALPFVEDICGGPSR